MGFSFVQGVASLGWQRQCPFCGWHWRRFLPEIPRLRSALFETEHIVGGGSVAESVCPVCGSIERHRHVYLYLKEMTDIFQRPVRLLHFAPESQLEPILTKQPNITYVSADLRSPLAEVRLDITKMPFADSSFDLVICNHVLEHIPNDRLAMSEILRVLVPGGWALLQVPIAATRARTESDPEAVIAERLQRFGQEDHVRIYGRDYPEILEGAGFQVDRHSLAREFGHEYALRHGILLDEDIYVARKSSAAPVTKSSQIPVFEHAAL
jgi:SAM-dependent methyltransferase